MTPYSILYSASPSGFLFTFLFLFNILYSYYLYWCSIGYHLFSFFSCIIYIVDVNNIYSILVFKNHLSILHVLLYFAAVIIQFSCVGSVKFILSYPLLNQTVRYFYIGSGSLLQKDSGTWPGSSPNKPLVSGSLGVIGFPFGPVDF